MGIVMGVLTTMIVEGSREMGVGVVDGIIEVVRGERVMVARDVAMKSRSRRVRLGIMVEAKGFSDGLRVQIRGIRVLWRIGDEQGRRYMSMGLG